MNKKTGLAGSILFGEPGPATIKGAYIGYGGVKDVDKGIPFKFLRTISRVSIVDVGILLQ